MYKTFFTKSTGIQPHNTWVYEIKHESSLSSLSTSSKCVQHSINFIFFEHPSPSAPPCTPVLSACSGGLLMVSALCQTHRSLQSLFSSSSFSLLFGGSTSSGNFLREVAWTIKSLKPSTPENVIISFSHLIYVHWVYNSAWDLFPFSTFKGFSSVLFKFKLSLAVLIFSKLKNYLLRILKRQLKH